MKKLQQFLFAMLLALGSMSLSAQQLYVGANYHPHDDKNPEKIARDIRLMKEAGINAVRMGEFNWGRFEPQEGKYDFTKLDKIIKELNIFSHNNMFSFKI